MSTATIFLAQWKMTGVMVHETLHNKGWSVPVYIMVDVLTNRLSLQIRIYQTRVFVKTLCSFRYIGFIPTLYSLDLNSV